MGFCGSLFIHLSRMEWTTDTRINYSPFRWLKMRDHLLRTVQLDREIHMQRIVWVFKVSVRSSPLSDHVSKVFLRWQRGHSSKKTRKWHGSKKWVLTFSVYLTLGECLLLWFSLWQLERKLAAVVKLQLCRKVGQHCIAGLERVFQQKRHKPTITGLSTQK